MSTDSMRVVGAPLERVQCTSIGNCGLGNIVEVLPRNQTVAEYLNMGSAVKFHDREVQSRFGSFGRKEKTPSSDEVVKVLNVRLSTNILGTLKPLCGTR